MITPRMQQVIDDLANDTSTDWQLVEGEKIRTGYGEGPEFWCCPLSWLKRLPANNWHTAGMRLGLVFDESIAIVHAADADSSNSYLRSALLRACRLSETP